MHEVLSVLSSASAHVVLIGTGHHTVGSRLPVVPEVTTSLIDLRHCLREHCGVAEERVRLVLDPVDPEAMHKEIRAGASNADDVFVFYYVGHGVLSPSGELHLATRGTVDLSQGRAASQALEFSAVRDAIATCPARTVIVVLDCCFSGRARLDLSSDAVLVASATREGTALVPEGSPHTLLTGELIQLLNNGDRHSPPRLTISRVTEVLSRRLQKVGQPLIVRYEGAVGNLVLAPNHAYTPPDYRHEPEVIDGASDISPYLGLTAYEEADADLFFGRDKITNQLIQMAREQISGNGLMIVTGESGAGKSSLLRAGLLPRIARGELTAIGSRAWSHVVITPGNDPFEALRKAVPDNILGDLGTEPTAMKRIRPHQSIRSFTERPLTLVVDQFEELFLQCAEDVQEAFIDSLSALGLSGKALVVIGVRSDHYGTCTADHRLEAAARNAVFVRTMTHDELHSVITKPAETAGLVVEPELIDLVLRDLDAHPTSRRRTAVLPLLSHALLSTWQRRTGRRLTVAGYLDAGAVAGSVAATAESLYTGLGDVGQRETRRILLQLVTVGDDIEDTRRTAERAELTLDGSADAVLQKLVHARLVTVDHDTVQITHDALLQAWPRLAEWISEDRQGLLTRRRLRQHAREWTESSRHASLLYEGPRLAAANAYAAATQITVEERQFLDASISREFALQAAELRRTRRLKQLLASLAALLLVTGILAGYSTWQRAVAEEQRLVAREQRDLAISRQIALTSNRLQGSDPALAAQLSLAAYRIAQTPEARSRLLETFVAPTVTRIVRRGGSLHTLAITGDGLTMATAGATSTDTAVLLWDLSDPNKPARIGPPLTGHTDAVYAVAFSPDGRTLATAGADRTLRLWDLSNPRRPVPASPPLAEHTHTIYSIAFRPDGRILATGSADKTVRLWDMSGRPRRLGVPLRESAGYVQTITFSPDGTILAAGDAMGFVRTWNITDPEQPAITGKPVSGSPNMVRSVAFSPDQRTLAAGGQDGIVRLWTVTRSKRLTSGAHFRGAIGWVHSVGYAPDGRTLAIATSDRGIQLYDVETRTVKMTLPHPEPTTVAVFLKGDRMLATSAADGVTRLWTLTSPVITGATRTVASVSYGPDSRLLSVASSDNRVTLWNVVDPRRPISYGPPLAAPARYGDIAGVATVSPDGRTLAAGTRNGQVMLWDITDPRRPVPAPHIRTGLTRLIESIAFSPDGKILAAGSDDGHIGLWNLANRRRPVPVGVPLNGDNGYVLMVAFSPDGRTLAAATAGDVSLPGRPRREGAVLLWDMTNQYKPSRFGRALEGPKDYVYSVAFSPDGRSLAAGNAKGTVQLWNISNRLNPRKIGPPLTGPDGYIYGLAFHPGMPILASGSGAGKVWLWNLANPSRPRTFATLDASRGSAFTVTFSPDGRLMTSGGSDGAARIWTLDPDRAAAHICMTAGDALSKEEWEKHVPGVDFLAPCDRHR
jgi:WD40 repeat protein